MNRRGFFAALVGLLGLSGCVEGRRWNSVVEGPKENARPKNFYRFEIIKKDHPLESNYYEIRRAPDES
jgi:hypothetical protein